MNKFINRIFYLNLDRNAVREVETDIYTENRKCLLLYSAIITGGMAILLFLSLFSEVLESSMYAYVGSVAFGIGMILLGQFLAKKHLKLVHLLQYIVIAFLLAFGIVLGTAVEPNRESTSFAVLMFVCPLLFTDYPVRTNTATIIAIIVYTIAAKCTQTPEMFSFNMSVVLPYGAANLVLTHFTGKMKIERFLYAHERKIMGEYDRLTGMPNRWSFEQKVEAHKALTKEGAKIAVCSFDVNSLKYVNDHYGHKAGDELLLAAAHAIDTVFGKYGVCYRIGGDEYAAVLSDNYPSAEALKKSLAEETAGFHSESGYGLSVSCGIIEGPPSEIEALIMAADKKMYEHKHEYYMTAGVDRRKPR